METVNLNLARKWRSKNFNEIVGQELSVRMLKNSLYLGHYFPVYLFSGQRGCGKTTTARVFAAAINCEKLPDFQKDPKNNPVPCLSCASCKAMLAGKHPDFIEIDAASHTGVDNVRQIIDAASLLPLMGRKKIYLIDEAHMQSKAAFNAFLKILEEPPQSVLFILATTDPDKIIDTVKSRCFQLFFKSVDAQILQHHLQHVCEKENIRHDEAGLSLIVKETGGSIRDALNLLEQVRFSSGGITKQAVLSVLGHLDDEQILALFDAVLHKGPKGLLQYLHKMKFELHSAEFIWRKLIELTRTSIWLKHGVAPVQNTEHLARIKRLVKKVSWKKLTAILQEFYNNEQLFGRTTAQHALLEMILLQLCQKNEDNNNASGSTAAPSTPDPDDEDEIIDDEDDEDEYEDEDEDEDEDEEEETSFVSSWNTFLKTLEPLDDPLINSVFKQGKPLQFHVDTALLDVEFSKDLAFFSDVLEDTKPVWHPLLQTSFGGKAELNSQFTGARKEIKKPVIEKPAVSPTPQRRTSQPGRNFQQARSGASRTSSFSGRNSRQKISLGKKLDVSDAQQWQKTHMILKHFPGTTYEMEVQ